MADKRNPKRKGQDSGRDPGGFSAIPWAVIDCPAYARLSHPARSLLMDIARQFVRDNNGRLLASFAYLKKRGWSSNDVITRAKRELLAAGFIHETVKGHRPNKASWYAITWQSLDRIPGYDFGAAETFRRSAYKDDAPLVVKMTRAEMYKKHAMAGKKVQEKNAALRPSGGVEGELIAPPHGVKGVPPTPSHGVIRSHLGTIPTPSHGDHLEMPSAAVGLRATAVNSGTLTPGWSDWYKRLASGEASASLHGNSLTDTQEPLKSSDATGAVDLCEVVL